MEEDFEIAAISAGLMERIGDSLTKRYLVFFQNSFLAYD